MVNYLPDVHFVQVVLKLFAAVKANDVALAVRLARLGDRRCGMAGCCARICCQMYANAHFFRRCRRYWGRRALWSGSFTAELGDQTRLTPPRQRQWHRIAPQPSLRCPRTADASATVRRERPPGAGFGPPAG